MEIITAPFGGTMNALFALGAVLIGIVLLVWLLKVLTGATGRAVRGRNRRLDVVESLALDPKRQLLIIRRDNIEHLILVGGPQDLLVESGITVDEAPAAQPARRPIPMAATRKPAQTRTASQAPVPAVVPPAQPPAAPSAPPATAIDQLRQMGQPTDKRAHLSLRHTGLLRPVSETELPVSPENSAPPVTVDPDSAKEDKARRDVEGTQLVEDNSEANRN